MGKEMEFLPFLFMHCREKEEYQYDGSEKKEKMEFEKNGMPACNHKVNW
jgi:uncharacterized protein YkuJ